jgi:hypothetical protein
MPRTCGTMDVHYRLLRTNPDYAVARTASENHAFEVARRGRPIARMGIVVIPTVVHVVYNNPTENISDSQIISQIEVLNRDYRMRNTDLGSVPQVFKPLIADAQVQFELAKTDPARNPTNGITRTPTTATSFVDDDRVKSAAQGGVDPWPADQYLNIWVCALGNSLLGYAQFPGGPAATDGVVITYTAFGTTGTATAPFNLGRTATHEIGHWLNLRHIWGDDGTGCNGSDFVDDTPNQAGSNVGTPAFPHVTCDNVPNGDLFMNYMDYVDDAAMFLFTAGQVTRMRAALDHERSTIGRPSEEPSGATSIDAGMAWPNGKAYFFRGSEYVRYDVAADRVDPGYPLPIAGNWSGFPAHFTTGIDAAVMWNNGKVYFFKGSEYVQYDLNTHVVDAGYPKPIAGNWPGGLVKPLDPATRTGGKEGTRALVHPDRRDRSA